MTTWVQTATSVRRQITPSSLANASSYDNAKVACLHVGLDVVEDGPDMQLLECAQADTWELSWSTRDNTFQVHCTTMPELCLFGYPRVQYRINSAPSLRSLLLLGSVA